MLLKKCIGLFALAGVVAASAVVGCSSTTVQQVPGDSGPGTDPDAKVTPTDSGRRDVTPPPTDGGGGSCDPQTVANPQNPTPAYKPYRKQAACTDAAINSFYTDCVADNATQATCQAWMTANATCNTCLITPSSDATWGPIVVVGREYPFNIAGCFGVTLNEGTSTTGCGAARWAWDRCLRTACPIANCCADPANCTATEEAAWTACREAAAQSSCATVRTDLETKCAALDSDANTALLNANCPLGDNVTLQQFTVAITKAFCGGATGDGGGGG